MTIQLHGDTDSDRLGLVDLIEVDVHQGISCGVELKFLHHSLVSLTVDSQVDNVHMRSVNHLAELGCGDGECQSLGQTILTFLLTIKVTGNQTLLAEFLCGFLAGSGTLLATDANFFHNCVTLN